MKKIFLTIVLLLFPICGQATEWWAGGAGAGALNGTSYADRWAFTGIVQSSINAGDTLHICGTNSNTSNALKLDWATRSGTEGMPITIDGLCDDPGSIDGREAVPGWSTSGNWTNHSGNVWYISTEAWTTYSKDSKRLWIDDVEQYIADSVSNSDVSKIIYGTFKANTSENRLYVYSVGNPATAFSSMIGLQNSSYTLRVRNVDYVNVTDIGLYGGGVWTINNQGAFHCNIANFRVGKGWGGIAVDGMGSTTYEQSRYGSIHDGEIDGVEIEYPSYTTELYSTDGIKLIAADHYDLYNLKVRNFGHTLIYLSLSDTNYTTGCVYNTVRDSELYSPNLKYSRAFGTDGMPSGGTGGYTAYNSFYRLNIHDVSVRAQFNGFSNKFYYSTISHMRDGGLKAYDVAQAIEFQSYSPYYTSHSNVVSNISIYDIDGVAISATDDTGTVYGHIIENCVGINTGLNSQDGLSHVAVYIPNQANTYAMSFINNYWYNAGYTNLFNYRGTAMNAATFNAADTNSDVLTDNIVADPSINTTTFIPLSGSPLIDSGVAVTGIHDQENITDYLKNYVSDTFSIGAIEYFDATGRFNSIQ